LFFFPLQWNKEATSAKAHAAKAIGDAELFVAAEQLLREAHDLTTAFTATPPHATQESLRRAAKLDLEGKECLTKLSRRADDTVGYAAKLHAGLQGLRTATSAVDATSLPLAEGASESPQKRPGPAQAAVRAEEEEEKKKEEKKVSVSPQTQTGVPAEEKTPVAGAKEIENGAACVSEPTLVSKSESKGEGGSSTGVVDKQPAAATPEIKKPVAKLADSGEKPKIKEPGSVEQSAKDSDHAESESGALAPPDTKPEDLPGWFDCINTR
jgi:hypothetical protein